MNVAVSESGVDHGIPQNCILDRNMKLSIGGALFSDKLISNHELVQSGETSTYGYHTENVGTWFAMTFQTMLSCGVA